MSRPTASPAEVPDGAVVATTARHLVIRASAGSGKTYQLVIRYLRTLLDGAPADRILASTFTRKAAGEILGRILGRLAKASRDPEDLRQLAAHLGVAAFDRDACLSLLHRLTRELHRMRVGTLDSFFAKLATSYTLELGLPPGWDIISDLDDAALRSQAIASVLAEGRSQDIARFTNLLSKGDAARSVSAKIHETVQEFYEIFQRTDAAAWHRFPDLFPLSSDDLAGTLDALRAAPLPDLKSYVKARYDDWQRATDQDWETFLSRGLASSVRRGRRTFGNSKQVISEEAFASYSRLIAHARAIIVRELASRTAATHELLARFDIAYRQLKRETRQLRFEDVTASLAGAIQEDALHHVAFRLDGDINHLLLDEFQDTSRSQWAVLRPFAERISRADAGTSFFCVGDAKQAIYGWRGGVAEIFDAVDHELPGISTAPLVESRRSSQVVIDTVNRLFSRLTLHPNLQDDEPAIREWCAAFDVHQTARDLDGYATVETPDPEETAGIDDVKDRVFSTTAQRVAQIVRDVPEATVGVLVRRNKSIAPLIHELRQRNIPASEEGGNPLTDAAAVQLILSLMVLADHPGDTVVRFHVATSPLGGLFQFVDHADDEAAATLAATLRRQLVDAGYGATVEQWARHLFSECDERDRWRLGQLVELAYRYDEQATLRPSRFVDFVSVEKVADPSPVKVRVMSIHQAKGLQFDAVVLPLVESKFIARTPRYVAAGPTPSAPPDRVSLYLATDLQDLLPDEFQQTFLAARAAQLRDELCCLYVAVTRAIHALHIVIPESRRTTDPLPRTTAGLIRAALDDTAGDGDSKSTLLYGHGDPDWKKPPSSAVGRETTPASDAPNDAPPRVHFAAMPDGRQRGMSRMAPSQVVGGARLRLHELVTNQRASALSRGTLLHAWFEQIEWIDVGSIDEDPLRQLARQHGVATDQIDQLLRDFRSMLERPAIADALSLAGYRTLSHTPPRADLRRELEVGSFDVDVQRERSVAVRLDSELLTGTIDRLVLLRRGGEVLAADILDFKTDAVGPAGPIRLGRFGHYRRQLASYRAAVSTIYGLPPQRITARLLFVESGDVIDVSDAAGDTEPATSS